MVRFTENVEIQPQLDPLNTLYCKSQTQPLLFLEFMRVSAISCRDQLQPLALYSTVNVSQSPVLL